MPFTTKLKALRDRSLMMTQSRLFFEKLNILEVDCPAISQAASVDSHIDLMRVHTPYGWRYLHSSPEYGMKRLLSMGIGDIYQLSHVYREGEKSEKHNPEFTMAEWYRLNFTFEEIIAETVEFIRLFLGNLPSLTLSYREAFLQYAHLDYVHASPSELIDCLNQHQIIPYPHVEAEGKDAILNLILGSLIEPYLGKEGLCILSHYPASQAALAKTCLRGDEHVAERFEVYYKGIELANGYHELADAVEQRERFIESNSHREQLGKDPLPIDEYFLDAMERGIPDCCGVAVGFDRLMMLKLKKEISEVIPFAWDEA